MGACENRGLDRKWLSSPLVSLERKLERALKAPHLSPGLTQRAQSVSFFWKENQQMETRSPSSALLSPFLGATEKGYPYSNLSTGGPSKGCSELLMSNSQGQALGLSPRFSSFQLWLVARRFLGRFLGPELDQPAFHAPSSNHVLLFQSLQVYNTYPILSSQWVSPAGTYCPHGLCGVSFWGSVFPPSSAQSGFSRATLVGGSIALNNVFVYGLRELLYPS